MVSVFPSSGWSYSACGVARTPTPSRFGAVAPVPLSNPVSLSPQGVAHAVGSVAKPANNASVAYAQWLASLPPGTPPILQTVPLQLSRPTQLSDPTPVPLANGAQGYVQQMKNAQFSRVAVVLPYSPEQFGLFHLLTDTLIQGSPERKTQMDALASAGITVALESQNNKLAILVEGNPGDEARLAHVAMALLQDLPQDARSFYTNQYRLLEQLVQEDNTPGNELTHAENRALFGPTHPRAYDEKQLFSQVAQVTPQQLQAFFQAYTAHPQQAQVLMVSPLPLAQQQQTLNQAITANGWLERPDAPPMPVRPLPPMQPNLQPNQPLLVADDRLPRAVVSLDWLTPGHRDAQAFDTFRVLTALLGGMSGPLFSVMRTQKGLVYSTNSSLLTDRDQSAFSVSASVDNDKIPQALAGLQQALATVVQHQPTQADLDKVKRDIVLKLRLERQQSATQLGHSLNRLVDGLAPEPVTAEEQRLLSITPQQVQQLAQTVLDFNGNTHQWAVAAPRAVLQQTFPGHAILQGNPLPMSLIAEIDARVEALEQTAQGESGLQTGQAANGMSRPGQQFSYTA